MTGRDGGEDSLGRGHRMSKLTGRSVGVCTREGGGGLAGGDQLARGCVGAGKDALQRFAAAGFRKVLNAMIRHHLFFWGQWRATEGFEQGTDITNL